MAVHQVTFLRPKLMVSWKCLSLQAFESRSTKHFAPVAYASTSDRFFRDLVEEGRPATDGVLWVMSRPIYRASGDAKITFPPTLTARIVVNEVLNGEVIRGWGGERDADLEVPPGDGEEFQAWRRAESVDGAARRSTFRITRDWARAKWKECNTDCAEDRKHKKPLSQLEAWKRVWTAIADSEESRFLAHVDATACLGKIFGETGLMDLSPEERGPMLTQKLQSPCPLSGRDPSCITDLEALARRGNEDTIFLNYRWNERRDDVARIGAELVDKGCGIWLDRLQIPDFKEHPVWRLKGRTRRKDPPQVELERLLLAAIEKSSLFLSLAWEDYNDDGRNWARVEREHAEECHQRERKPDLGLVDLGGAPEDLIVGDGLRWRYEGDPSHLAGRIATRVRDRRTLFEHQVR